MKKLFGNEISKESLMKRIGDISQVAGVRTYTLREGRAEGVKAVDVRTQALNFTVLMDRGMDIAWADYKGTPISYISNTGVCSPFLFEEPGKGFLRNFTAGLLTTCGLTSFGAPCRDAGEELGLHGRISNIPAENESVYAEWEGDDYVMRIRGKMRQSRVFGENLTLTREIETRLLSDSLTIRDTVENCGFSVQPLMLLYHINFGYPIVDRDTVLVQSKTNVKARDEEAQKGIDTFNVFSDPVPDYKEQVFYHDMEPDADGFVTACLFNKNLGENGLGAYVRFNKNQLPLMCEWKQVGEGEYVIGLEPGTAYPEGRAQARKDGQIIFLKPGEKKGVQIEIGVVDSIDRLKI
ncbi:MAG: aldose 1-epimerase family protein [Burkholderiales bacterium]